MKFNFIKTVALFSSAVMMNACNSPKEQSSNKENSETAVEQQSVAENPVETPVENKQEVAKPKALSQSGTSTKDIVPNGWEVRSESTGDMNKDGIADLAFVVFPDDEANILVREFDGYKTNCNKPILAIYWGNSDGKFTKYSEWNNVLMEQDESSSYDELSTSITDKGVLRIKERMFHSMGSNTNTLYSYLFRFQNDKFYLIGSDVEEVDRMSGEEINTSTNYLIGKRIISVSNIESKAKPKQKEETFKEELKALGDFEL